MKKEVHKDVAAARETPRAAMTLAKPRTEERGLARVVLQFEQGRRHRVHHLCRIILGAGVEPPRPSVLSSGSTVHTCASKIEVRMLCSQRGDSTRRKEGSPDVSWTRLLSCARVWSTPVACRMQD